MDSYRFVDVVLNERDELALTFCFSVLGLVCAVEEFPLR